jgi:hypothetical protein
MGTGRTLNKDPRTRPIKSQGEKRRRSKAQRARLIKLGLDEAVVSKMLTEEVRKLVQKPVLVKKMVAKKDAPAKPAKKAVAKKAPAAPEAAPAPKAKKAAPAKKPAAKKPAAE